MKQNGSTNNKKEMLAHTFVRAKSGFVSADELKPSLKLYLYLGNLKQGRKGKTKSRNCPRAQTAHKYLSARPRSPTLIESLDFDSAKL